MSPPALSSAGATGEAISSRGVEFPVEASASWSKAERALVERTLDLEGLKPSPARRAELVKQAAAGAETGIFYIKNFGMDLGLLDQVRRQAYGFFAQPVEEKAKTVAYLPDPDGRTYGYSFDAGGVFMATATEGVARPRYREVYRARMFPESTRLDKAWPPAPAMAGFKEKLLQYAEQMREVVEFLSGLLAEGLGLPPSYITDTYGGHLLVNVMLANLLPKEQATKPAGMHTHSDSNLFNLNVSDGVRGLQFHVGGEWITTPALLDCALFDVGEDLETISNGGYHAPYHRVVSGPRQRVSILTTCDVGRDEIIGPAPQLIDHQNPARYRTRRQADRTQSRMHASQNSLKTDRTKSTLVFDPAHYLDRTDNLYEGEDGLLYINGVELVY